MIRLHEGLQSICLVSINKDWWQALTSLQVTCIGAGNTCWLHGIYSWQMRSYEKDVAEEFSLYYSSSSKILKTSSILNIIVSIYEGERTSYSKYEKVIWSEVL